MAKNDTNPAAGSADDPAPLPEATYYESQQAMRSGPRSYTQEQAEWMRQVVEQRQPLQEKPLPLEEL